MNRPSKDQLNEAMLDVESLERSYSGAEELLMDSDRRYQVTLGREVRALREELEGLQRCDCNPDMTDLEEENERMQESIDLYRATIARVEALVGQFLAEDNAMADSCAHYLEAALKGEP